MRREMQQSVVAAMVVAVVIITIGIYKLGASKTTASASKFTVAPGYVATPPAAVWRDPGDTLRCGNVYGEPIGSCYVPADSASSACDRHYGCIGYVVPDPASPYGQRDQTVLVSRPPVAMRDAANYVGNAVFVQKTA